MNKKKQEDTIKYLNQSFYIDKEINSKIDHLNLLDDHLKKLTTIFKDTPPSSTRKVDSVQDTIANIMDLKTEINEHIDKFVDLQREIMSVIAKVPNFKYRTLLTYRYLNFQKWELIAIEMNYSIQYIYDLHKEALKEVEKIISKTRVNPKESDCIRV